MNRLQRWRRRALLTIISLLVLGFVYQRLHDSRATRKFPMPGRLVDLGTHRLHSYLLGDSGPLVILESGLGGESYTWKPIQTALSAEAKVLAYDRAGYGWSDVSPYPRSNLQAVKELRAMLKQQDLAPPYVLVGHSMGGLNMRLFASMHPDEVSGLVLIDAYNRDLFDETTDVGIISPIFRLGHLTRHFGSHQLIVPGLIRQALQEAVDPTEELENQMRAFKSRTRFVDTYIEEDREPNWLEARKQMRNLGSLPVTVITAERPIERYRDWWPASQLALQQSVANQPTVIEAPCGHAVHLEQPDLVIRAVQDMLKQIRETADTKTDAPAPNRNDAIRDSN